MQVPWSWMYMIAFVIFIADVVLLITWQALFNPRAVKVLREVSLNRYLSDTDKIRLTSTW